MQNRPDPLLPYNGNTRATVDQVHHRHSFEAGGECDTIAGRRASSGRANLIHRVAAARHKGLQLRRSAYACLFLFVLSGLASAQAVDQTDNQLWSDVQVAVPITKDIDFNILGTLRVGRDISRPVDERIGTGFTFRFGQHVQIAPNYLYIATQPVRDRKLWESRLSLPVTLRFNVDKFRISDRNLFERRIRRPGITSTRYRNRLQVDHAIGPDKLSLSLFVADEVFYDWSLNRWPRNRFAVGGSKVFNKHFTQDVYYLRQNDSFSVPGDLHVIGTTLRVKL